MIENCCRGAPVAKVASSRFLVEFAPLVEGLLLWAVDLVVVLARKPLELLTKWGCCWTWWTWPAPDVVIVAGGGWEMYAALLYCCCCCCY